ncbi:MAG: hypothetical protein S4CHLAM123_02300 [Chlamydiales bacterium]|nr:hypothetical protein [Chlamydiales bacterium]
MRFLFFICVLLAMSNLKADNGDCWEIYGEYLYLCPSVDDTYFVIQSSENPSLVGNRINNDFSFESGFRVGGAFRFCNGQRALRADYARLTASTHKAVSEGFLSATVGRADLVTQFQNYVGSATSDLDLSYKRVNGLFVQQLWNNCFELNLLAGIEYASIDYDETDRFTRVVGLGEVDQHTEVWGVGPQFGFELGYNLYRSCFLCPGTFSITGKATGSLLASENRSNAFNSIPNGGTILNISDKSTERLIPVIHARIGLKYASRLFCFGTSIEAGYEFSSYLRAITKTIYTADTANSLSFSNYNNFDIQGLYIAGILSF